MCLPSIKFGFIFLALFVFLLPNMSSLPCCCCQGDDEKEPKFYADRGMLTEFNPSKHKKYNADHYYQPKSKDRMEVLSLKATILFPDRLRGT